MWFMNTHFNSERLPIMFMLTLIFVHLKAASEGNSETYFHNKENIIYVPPKIFHDAGKFELKNTGLFSEQCPKSIMVDFTEQFNIKLDKYQSAKEGNKQVELEAIVSDYKDNIGQHLSGFWKNKDTEKIFEIKPLDWKLFQNELQNIKDMAIANLEQNSILYFENAKKVNMYAFSDGRKYRYSIRFDPYSCFEDDKKILKITVDGSIEKWEKQEPKMMTKDFWRCILFTAATITSGLIIKYYCNCCMETIEETRARKLAEAQEDLEQAEDAMIKVQEFGEDLYGSFNVEGDGMMSRMAKGENSFQTPTDLLEIEYDEDEEPEEETGDRQEETGDRQEETEEPEEETKEAVEETREAEEETEEAEEETGEKTSS